MSASFRSIAVYLRSAGLLAALVCLLSAMFATAQNTKAGEAKLEHETIFLHHVFTPDSISDVQIALRSQLPQMRIYSIANQNAITISGTAEDLAVAHKIVADLDKPVGGYRLTYSFVTVDAGKRGPARQYVLLVSGERHSSLKQGARVPILSAVGGEKDAKAATGNVQIQYIDVGLHIDASVHGMQAETVVEESAVSEERSGIGAQAPILRQTALNEHFVFTSGKPVVLGSLAIPGTTQHELVEVTIDPVE